MLQGTGLQGIRVTSSAWQEEGFFGTWGLIAHLGLADFEVGKEGGLLDSLQLLSGFRHAQGDQVSTRFGSVLAFRASRGVCASCAQTLDALR